MKKKTDYDNTISNSNEKTISNSNSNEKKTKKKHKSKKSKEQFLKNLSPICVLPIDQISAINIAKPKKNKNKKYHLIICNKLGIQRDFNNSIFLNAFDSSEINNYISSPDANESLLIFTSDNEKELLHWYIVIQYIIEFSKI